MEFQANEKAAKAPGILGGVGGMGRHIFTAKSGARFNVTHGTRRASVKRLREWSFAAWNRRVVQTRNRMLIVDSGTRGTPGRGSRFFQYWEGSREIDACGKIWTWTGRPRIGFPFLFPSDFPPVHAWSGLHALSKVLFPGLKSLAALPGAEFRRSMGTGAPAPSARSQPGAVPVFGREKLKSLGGFLDKQHDNRAPAESAARAPSKNRGRGVICGWNSLRA